MRVQNLPTAALLAWAVSEIAVCAAPGCCGRSDGIRPAPHLRMAGARHFEELDCWRLASQLKTTLLSICRRPAVSTDFEFVGQVRSAARSAPNNIAEGFRRRTHGDFARFLDIARGSLMESQNLLRDALESGYISQAEFDSLRSLASRALGATTALQRYLRNNPSR